MRKFICILILAPLLSCTSNDELMIYDTISYHYNGGAMDTINYYRYKAKIRVTDTAFVYLEEHPDLEKGKSDLLPIFFLLEKRKEALKFEPGVYYFEDQWTYQIDGKEEEIYKFSLMNGPIGGAGIVFFHPEIGEIINFDWGWLTVRINERVSDSDKNELLTKIRTRLLADTVHFPGKAPK